ncbi:hypothetical protein ABEB36_015280 [Hypothenemus hampei]|uniref:DDE Tnp4 domain-containing protein n=1 Tax=Hypothenemus hampei TaxID=57062 RepID=A0ABD1E002_HYPHA
MEESNFSDSSGFLSESDDEQFINDIVEIRQINENYLRMIVPQYNDQVFLEHFRISRNILEPLVISFEASQYDKYHLGPNGARDQVLICFWYMDHQTASFHDIGDRSDFLSNKSNHMQVVCDHTMRIIDIFTGFLGSVHDSRVFKRSSLSRTIQQKCGDNMFIIGDSGYPSLRVH